MGHDGKYGVVTTEHGDIPEEEPVIIFRAKDALAVEALSHYLELCRKNGSPIRHQRLVSDAMARFLYWQERNLSHIPNSARSKEWLND